VPDDADESFMDIFKAIFPPGTWNTVMSWIVVIILIGCPANYYSGIRSKRKNHQSNMHKKYGIHAHFYVHIQVIFFYCRIKNVEILISL